MKQRTAILIAAALTTFVLVLAGSLVYAINSKTISANLAAETQANATQPQDNPNANSEQIGNPASLPQAKGAASDISVPAQPTTAPTTAPTSAPPTARPTLVQAKLVSAERATQIAINLLPGSVLQQAPDLVNYKGKMAYEVLLDVAAVYVDAFTGKILGTTAMVAQNQQPPTDSGTGGGDNGGGGDGGGRGNRGNGGQKVNNPIPQPPTGGGGNSGGSGNGGKKGGGGGHKGGGGDDDGGHDGGGHGGD